jgi:hypothetical protein
MAKLLLTLALLAALAGTHALQGAPGAKSQAEPARIADLIAKLGSKKFSERQAATRSLAALGLHALEALHKATDSPDAEVSRRAQILIRKIVKQDETAKVLKPTRVHLVYKDTPLETALEDLRQKSGISIGLRPGGKNLAGRTITLDTGETSFWQAFDQFCAKAGLVEADLLAAAVGERPVDQEAQYRERLIYQQRMRRLQMRGERFGRPQPAGVNPNQLLLVDGKSPVVATCYLGSVRVQAIAVKPARNGSRRKQQLGPRDIVDEDDSDYARPETTKNAGKPHLALVVKPEPKMAWYQLQHLGVASARDERNQAVVGAKALEDFSQEVISSALEDAVSYRTVSPWPGAPVRIDLGHRPVKKLKELFGKIEAQVQSPPRPRWTMANILKAKGRTQRNEDGALIKVRDVRREQDGMVRILLEVSTDASNGVMRGRGGRVRRIRFASIRGSTINAGDRFELLDNKGNSFLRYGTDYQEVSLNGNTFTQEIEVTFQPGTNQGQAAKLVLTGSRPTIITVPFTLRDIKTP